MRRRNGAVEVVENCAEARVELRGRENSAVSADCGVLGEASRGPTMVGITTEVILLEVCRMNVIYAYCGRGEDQACSGLA